MSGAASRLQAFYDLRASEEPGRDSEALLRFRNALVAAELGADERGALYGPFLDLSPGAVTEVQRAVAEPAFVQ
jgi:hypothetical protein